MFVCGSADVVSNNRRSTLLEKEHSAIQLGERGLAINSSGFFGESKNIKASHGARGEEVR